MTYGRWRIHCSTAVTVVLVACGGSGEPSGPTPQPVPVVYTVSGSVLDPTGVGIAGVTIDMGSHGTVTTAADGAWSKSGITGTATIIAQKSGWTFSPTRVDVTSATASAHFSGAPAVSAESAVKILIRWNEVATSLSPNAMLNAPLFSHQLSHQELTHVGARLEYASDNAFFAQAVTRQAAETHGIITLAVPPTPKARLLVAAVQYEVGSFPTNAAWKRNQVVRLGVVDSVHVVQGQTRVVQYADIRWIVPNWDVPDATQRSQLLSGRMQASKAGSDFRFNVDVRDPFQEGLNPPYDNLLIAVNGTTGQFTALPNGYRRFPIICPNTAVGQDHLSSCHFYPYLASERFNLPTARYVVLPLADPFEVEWK